MDREDYLSTVASLIAAHFVPDDLSGSMTAAKVGSIVATFAPAKSDPTTFGFEKLTDALSKLHESGAIHVGYNSKGVLAVWTTQQAKQWKELHGTSSSDKPQPQSPVSRMPATHPSSRLEKAVWLAVVGEYPPGRRFINRDSGEVKMGCVDSPGSSDEWVEIVPLSPIRQKEFASAFLEAEGIAKSDALFSTLESSMWFRELQESLRARNSLLLYKWNLLRTERAIEHVMQWAKTHEFPLAMLFRSHPTSRKQSFVGNQEAGVPTELKRALLAAIESMGVRNMLELWLPARTLVRHLRPDLLQLTEVQD